MSVSQVSTSINLDMINQYFEINMRYHHGANNIEIGESRAKLTIIITARFGMSSPTVLSELYSISVRQAREHLNKLVCKGLLLKVETVRSIDKYVFICSRIGKMWCEELTAVNTPYKHFKDPTNAVNQNNIMHDLSCTFLMMRMLQEKSSNLTNKSVYSGMLSETEFKRIFTQSETRNVDGLLVQYEGNERTVIALDYENSTKLKAKRQVILLKYLQGLRGGIYSKIFIVSQKHSIIADIKRFHEQLLEELPYINDKKTKMPILSKQDVVLLKRSIVYRTKYCDDLRRIFYP